MRGWFVVAALLAGRVAVAEEGDGPDLPPISSPFTGDTPAEKQADAIWMIGGGAALTIWGGTALALSVVGGLAAVVGAGGIVLGALFVSAPVLAVAAIAPLASAMISIVIALGVLTAGLLLASAGRQRWKEGAPSSQAWSSGPVPPRVSREEWEQPSGRTVDRKKKKAAAPRDAVDAASAIQHARDALAAAGYEVQTEAGNMLMTRWKADGPEESGRELRLRVLIEGAGTTVVGECHHRTAETGGHWETCSDPENLAAMEDAVARVRADVDALTRANAMQ